MSTGTVLRHSFTSLGKSPSLPELEQRLNPKQLQRGLKHFCFLGIGLNILVQSKLTVVMQKPIWL